VIVSCILNIFGSKFGVLLEQKAVIWRAFPPRSLNGFFAPSHALSAIIIKGWLYATYMYMYVHTSVVMSSKPN